jgi:putative FmdB family regulatory protein
MPTYDFKCPKCDARKNHYFSFSDEHKLTCECGTAMEKVFQATPSHFKGGGWGGQP